MELSSTLWIPSKKSYKQRIFIVVPVYGSSTYTARNNFSTVLQTCLYMCFIANCFHYHNYKPSFVYAFACGIYANAVMPSYCRPICVRPCVCVCVCVCCVSVIPPRSQTRCDRTLGRRTFGFSLFEMSTPLVWGGVKCLVVSRDFDIFIQCRRAPTEIAFFAMFCRFVRKPFKIIVNDYHVFNDELNNNNNNN